MTEANKLKEMHRRTFLKTGLGAAALGAGAFQTVAQEPAKKITLRDTIPAREFGKAGHRLPVLAIGGAAIVERWAPGYGVTLPPFDQRVAMVRCGYEMGIRYFDTSRNYRESESIMGEALKDVRGNLYLASKVGVPGSDDGILERGQVRASLEKSLEELQTDYLDCVQVHGPVFEYVGYDRAMEIYEELAKLREEKLFRFIGITSHTAFETMYKLIDTGLFDQALIAYGYFPKGMNTMLSHANMEWRQMCLSRASELGMGVLAMKTLGSFVFGHRAKALAPGFEEAKLKKLRQAALRWVLRDNRISTLLVGISLPGDIDENIETLRGNWTFTGDDRKLLAEFSAQAFRNKIIQEMKIT
jgi:aryl-alcohol dehydrogenase-like predicted oxidoreductase